MILGCQCPEEGIPMNHIGQIVFVRKLQGSWDPEKGVK
jgi:hypothetical protein